MSSIVTKPLFAFKMSEREIIEVYPLREGQSLRYPGVKEDSARAYYTGPGIVTVTRGVGSNYCDHHVDDAGLWAWISELVQNGTATGKVTSCTDQIEAQREYRAKLEAEGAERAAEKKRLAERPLEERIEDFVDRHFEVLSDVEEAFFDDVETQRATLRKLRAQIDEQLRNL